MDERLDPRVRQLWYAQAVVAGVVLGAIVLGVLLIVEIRNDVASWVWIVASLGVAAVLVGGVVHVPIAYRAWRYRLGPEALELRHGVAWRLASALPYHRIQQVDVSQGPIERRLGIATLKLRSAAATTDATLPGLAAPDVVDALRRTLLVRAGVDDGA